jgi:hypothetical protein
MKLFSIVKTTKSLREENASSLCVFHSFMGLTEKQLQPATFEITDNKSFPCQPKMNQPDSNKKGNNKKQAARQVRNQKK